MAREPLKLECVLMPTEHMGWIIVRCDLYSSYDIGDGEFPKRWSFPLPRYEAHVLLWSLYQMPKHFIEVNVKNEELLNGRASNRDCAGNLYTNYSSSRKDRPEDTHPTQASIDDTAWGLNE